MNTRRLYLTTAGLALIAGGCTQQAPAPAPAPVADTRAADEAALRDADEAWANAARSGDVNQMLMAYAPDAVVQAPNEPMANDEETRRKNMTAAFSMPGFALTWTATHAEAARSGDLGYTLGTYEMTTNDAEGKPSIDHGKYVTVWRKQDDGTWKVIVDAFNSDMPLSKPEPAKEGKKRK